MSIILKHSTFANFHNVNFRTFRSRWFTRGLITGVIYVGLGGNDGSGIRFIPIGYNPVRAFLSRIPFLLSISRRMMMTSGSGVNYKSMFDAGSQVNQHSLYLFICFLHLVFVDHRERGDKVAIQRRWSQYSQGRGWCWCPCSVRQVARNFVWKCLSWR